MSGLVNLNSSNRRKVCTMYLNFNGSHLHNLLNAAIVLKSSCLNDFKVF